MASSPETLSMALFCDFENVALGVRDAQYDKFDIKPVLERLLLKGSIVVKKAYCDWERYKGFKSKMHEANFELIEIPHVRQSGKNSADIRLVVDALDLCYTKSHVNTFVIISGDSDFSPLVSKLRENAKTVIGVGVKQSTSDLLIANCDEFIFYDDLVREIQRAADQRAAHSAQRRKPEEDRPRKKDDLEVRRTQAVELAAETFDALMAERGDSGKIWASVLKEAIKRRRPDFSESYYGFRAFGNLLEEAQARGLMSFGRDEKSGAYVYRAAGSISNDQEQVVQTADSLTFDAAENTGSDSGQAGSGRRRDGAARREATEGRRRGRQPRNASARPHADVADIGDATDVHDAMDVHDARDAEDVGGAEARPTTPFVVPVPVRSAFDPHAPENTTPVAPNRGRGDAPAGTSDDDRDDVNAEAQSADSAESGTPSSTRRATRAGRTPRKPRASRADKAADAASTSDPAEVTTANDGADQGTAANTPATAGVRAGIGANANQDAERRAEDATAGTPSARARRTASSSAAASPTEAVAQDSADEARPAPRKTASRARRPRKTPAVPDAD